MSFGLGIGFGFPLDQVEAGGGSDLVVVSKRVGCVVGDMDGHKRSLMAIGYNNEFKVNSELSDVSYWCS